MTWPEGMPLLEVSADSRMVGDGARPARYRVELDLLNADALLWDGTTVVTRGEVIRLDAEPDTGAVAGSVPHLSAAGLTPSGAAWRVREWADGRQVRSPWAWIPTGDEVGPVDLDMLAPLALDEVGRPVAVGPQGEAGLAAWIIPDPDHPGGYLIVQGTTALTESETYPGGYLIGAA